MAIGMAGNLAVKERSKSTDRKTDDRVQAMISAINELMCVVRLVTDECHDGVIRKFSSDKQVHLQLTAMPPYPNPAYRTRD